jgi:uncharacterized protein
MKYLLVLVVVGAVLWLMFGRDRRAGRAEATRQAAPAKPKTPVLMLTCAHCSLNLPRTEALFDASGRPFCSEAHRLAGPR